MTLAEAQRQVDNYIQGTAAGYFPEIVNLARLMEEVGEMARIYCRRGPLRPRPGDDISPEALKEEMGDTLFVLLCLANQAGIDLDEALDTVLAKFQIRDKDRHHPAQG
ncbi:MAG: nucleotide pyrophosphohydrolase [Spirochaetales bacterium]|nr:nucleotide pyrophosphohydrolase [Spirochaetales bacterium]